MEERERLYSIRPFYYKWSLAYAEIIYNIQQVLFVFQYWVKRFRKRQFSVFLNGGGGGGVLPGRQNQLWIWLLENLPLPHPCFPETQSTCSCGKRMGNNFGMWKTFLTDSQTHQHFMPVPLKIQKGKPQLSYLHMTVKNHSVAETCLSIRSLSR